MHRAKASTWIVMTTLLFAVGMAGGCEAPTSLETQAVAGNPDAMFMTDAAMASNGEIALSEVAMNQAMDNRVRQFARQMVQDHRRVNYQLGQLASVRGVSLPTRVPQQAAIKRDHFEQLSGRQLDQRYLGAMIADHARMLAILNDGAATAEDPQIRAWAEQQIPIIREHLVLAEELNNELLQARGIEPPPSALPNP